MIQPVAALRFWSSGVNKRYKLYKPKTKENLNILTSQNEIISHCPGSERRLFISI